MPSTPPTQAPPSDGSTANAGSMNQPLTVPIAFVIGLGGGVGAGIGFGIVTAVMEMMKG